jgi:hypothetical protein
MGNKRNVFGDIPQQLLAWLLMTNCNSRLHVDKELRDKVVDTLIWDKQNIFLSCSSFRFLLYVWPAPRMMLMNFHYYETETFCKLFCKKINT